MFSKTLLTNNICLGKSYTWSLSIEVMAKLGLETKKTSLFQKYISCNKQPLVFEVKN